tara:strand:+ start:466 stop:711 length:246 start_codon:yes stop_codon:yes gene_type:complete
MNNLILNSTNYIIDNSYRRGFINSIFNKKIFSNADINWQSKLKKEEIFNIISILKIYDCETEKAFQISNYTKDDYFKFFYS